MVWSSRLRPHHGFIILCSTIKIDANGSQASQAQYNFGHHVNMQLIKIPTTSYVNATLKRWGHDSQGRGRGKYSNPWANGEKPNVKGKIHKVVNYPFCLLCTVIQKLVGEVNAWGWEEYEIQILIWEANHFWKTCFWLVGKVNPWKCMPKPLFTHVLHSSPILIHVEALSCNWSLLSSLSLTICCRFFISPCP